LSGLVENAERPIKIDEDDEWVLIGPVVPVKSVDAASAIITADGVDAKNRVSGGFWPRAVLLLTEVRTFECS
jgi:hypothetical protein